ncbi:MAG: large conductance mechanosensitive channel protein MscL [Gammaproteobacteria bacterium]|nr:large conductance mechanosensitive channel protein MscL [Gammaproteobacteria bacterium]MDE1888509.1 large conductance mechanosensitive channel protein MscL [Gammaproteobacteria bacterium]MDE2023293.1 large conductance mechanosensitive channel protein MscL [Gammaproteobacteria bacterium]MDE2139364.1 large conductance mechanosensitive channel protein MscL [Gammaproteobacteria bacterium]MDE2273876.1 large conductance mechanosensitive channel protein MscL [Gammaproteobacteria bacterium]
MLKDFQAFVMRGNVVDMAVGIVIGAAFGAIVKSLVDDVVMPPIGLALGNVDFSNLFVVLKEGAKQAGPYATIVQAHAAGAVTLNYGLFINTIITFIIIAIAMFIVIKLMVGMQNKLHKPAAAAPTTKECPQCFSTINIKATRCPNCTSDI